MAESVGDSPEEIQAREARKAELLSDAVEQIDITSFDASSPVNDQVARAANLYDQMVADPDCSIILSLAGPSSLAGCRKLFADLIKFNMVDAVVATGAYVVDIDFFSALGFDHYLAGSVLDERELRTLGVARIFDRYVDREALEICDRTIAGIANGLEDRPFSSREFIEALGRWLGRHAKSKDSLVELAFKHHVPVFCPDLSVSRAGFGLALHQHRARGGVMTLDSIADIGELTEIRGRAKKTGVLCVDGGVPMAFLRNCVEGAEALGKSFCDHHYVVRIDSVDAGDGTAFSGSDYDDASEERICAEAATVLPLIASDVYSRGAWKDRARRSWLRIFS